MTATKTAVAAAAVLTTVLALGACSTGTETAASSSTAASTSAPASAQAHNHADVMFARHMIPHHQQAVEMSDMILAKKGIDPRVTELATQIKAAQGPEIEQMRGWLTEWGVPAEMPAMDMSGMDMPRAGNDPDDGADHHGDMPGESMMPTTSMMPSGWTRTAWHCCASVYWRLPVSQAPWAKPVAPTRPGNPTWSPNCWRVAWMSTKNVLAKSPW